MYKKEKINQNLAGETSKRVSRHSMKITQSVITYENLPINGIVCGIQFDPIKQLQSAHFGVLWQKFRHDFPETEDQIIVGPVSEEDIGSPDPPLPRVRFIYANENEFIQVERDRFLHNWRKRRPEDESLGSEKVVENFEKHLSRFQEFLLEENLGNFVAREYELRYIDLIPKGQRWENPGGLENVLPSWLSNPEQSRLLENVIGIDRPPIDLPDALGQLRTSIHSVQRNSDDQEVFFIDLNALSNQPYQPMRTWFEDAHNAVTNFLHGESGMFDIFEPREENTGASNELNFEQEIESEGTQEFADTQPQVPAFPFYNEEDILNLDAVIFTPPPVESGTLRVKLIYEEPSKPIPIEDPWKE